MGAKHTQVGKFYRSNWGWLAPVGKLGVHAYDAVSDALETPEESEASKRRREFHRRGAQMQPTLTDDMLRVFQDQQRRRPGRSRQSFFDDTLLGGGR